MSLVFVIVWCVLFEYWMLCFCVVLLKMYCGFLLVLCCMIVCEELRGVVFVISCMLWFDRYLWMCVFVLFFFIIVIRVVGMLRCCRLIVMFSVVFLISFCIFVWLWILLIRVLLIMMMELVDDVLLFICWYYCGMGRLW